jgi:hypothetical protein
MVALVVAAVGLLVRVVLSSDGSGTSGDVRPAAVAAWHEGNAAWASGDIAAVCDTFDAIGPEGMWATTEICLGSEGQGYEGASDEQKSQLKAMTVDPEATEQLADDTVVIWLRDAQVDGVPSQYFAESDVAVMRLTDGGWRQIGARYSGTVVGTVPAQVQAQESPPPSRSAAVSTDG